MKTRAYVAVAALLGAAALIAASPLGEQVVALFRLHG